MVTVQSTKSVVGRQTAIGGTWTVASRMVARVIDLATMVVLAHLLQPKDFGLVAIAMTVIYIVEAALELPVGQALVRLDRIDTAHFDTAFTLGLMRGLVLSFLVCLISWPFAHFYADHRLIPLVCALSLAPAMRGLASPRLASFSKNFDFTPDFTMELLGKLAAFAVGVGVAVTTRSYWSIAIGTVLAPTVSTITSYVLAPYRPRLSLSELPVFSGFLGWITAAQVVSSLNWQADRLLLGKLSSRAALGLFTAANDTANIPMLALLSPIMRPLLSGFTAVRDDLPRLRRSYLSSAGAIVTLALPILVGESLIAEPGVRLIFGQKWLGAAPLLRWLAISLIPTLFAAPLGPLVMSFGRTQIFFKRNLFEICVKLPLVVLGAIKFGFMGVVVARGISETATVCFCMIVVKRLIGVPLRQQVLGPWRSIVSAAAMAAVVALLLPELTRSTVTGWLALGTVTAVAAGAIIYCGALFSLWYAAGRPAGLEAMVAERLSGILRVRRHTPAQGTL